MKLLISLLLVTVLCLSHLPVTWAIVGGVTSKPPEPDEPVLFSPNARIEGLRKNTNGLYSFLGIRYANVEKRFTRCQYQRLMGDVDATQHGMPCAQPDPKNNRTIIGTEDCLTLNVFSPKMPDGESTLPVIFWIHGGGYRYGSAAQYGPDALTDNNVVFVAIQYRLGTLGILGSGTKEFPGNLALQDAAMALRWVSENIEAFGGDPNNIKLMGHGSGAVMAMELSTTEFAKSKKITGVVAMSGSLFSRHSIEETPQEAVMQVADLNECSGKSDDIKVIINCLRQRRFQDIIRVDNRIAEERLQKRGAESGMTGFNNFLPHVEEKNDNRGLPGFLTETPMETIMNRNLPDVPLLIGNTAQETANGLNLKKLKSNFGSYDNFLKNLTAPAKLKQITGLVTAPLNVLPIQLPDVSKYLAIPNNLNPLQILSKVTEITTDVLFNLPATLMADSWSKAGSPAFMYQFDFFGKNTAKGNDIFPWLPIVSDGGSSPDQPQMDMKSGMMPPVAHGDDLAYLFDLADVFGNPIKKREMTPTEREVKYKFTNLITDFLSFSGNSTKKDDMFRGNEFSSKGSSYIQISDKVNVKKDFRFCALSLWGASLESSSGQTDCKTSLLQSVLPLNVPLQNVPLVNTLNRRPLPTVQNLGGGGGFLGLG